MTHWGLGIGDWGFGVWGLGGTTTNQHPKPQNTTPKK